MVLSKLMIILNKKQDMQLFKLQEFQILYF